MFKDNFTKGLTVGVLLTLFVTILSLWPYLKQIQKEKLIMSYVNDLYVNDYDKKDLKEVYSGIFDKLDDYSCYYTKDEFKELMNSSDGNYCGIGIVTSYSDNLNHLVIRQVYENSPAEEKGLKKDDEILAINGNSTENMKDVELATAEMKGEAGTEVTLTIVSHGEKKDVTLTRANVDYASTKVQLLDDEVGYMRIYTFDEKASKEIRKNIDYFKKKGITKVIIDIRSNPGGVITSLVDSLEELVPKQLVLTTKTKDGKQEEYSMKKGTTPEFTYVLLINENTASCAEIFASVFKNGNYATLIGTPTFGKGVAQSIIPLYDGSGIKITTEEWFDNNGININGNGIAPDIRVHYRYLGDDEFEDDIMKDTQVLKAYESIR